MSFLARGPGSSGSIKRGTALLLTALAGSGICALTVLAALSVSRTRQRQQQQQQQQRKKMSVRAHHDKHAHEQLESAAARYQAEREDMGLAIEQILEYVEEERLNADTLDRLRTQLLALEEKLAASAGHVEELERSFEAALHQHQQQTSAALAPLRKEMGYIRQQFETLLFALNAVGSGSTAAPSPVGTTTKTASAGAAGSAPDAGGVLLAPEEAARLELQQEQRRTKEVAKIQSHLQTLAGVLGMKEHALGGGVDPAGGSPRYDVVSDWAATFERK